MKIINKFQLISREEFLRKYHAGDYVRLLYVHELSVFLKKHNIIDEESNRRGILVKANAYPDLVYILVSKHACAFGTVSSADIMNMKVYMLDLNNSVSSKKQEKIENSTYCNCQNPNLVENEVNFQKFKYCRTCKKEAL